jgi:hypothetical protein
MWTSYHIITVLSCVIYISDKFCDGFFYAVDYAMV